VSVNNSSISHGTLAWGAWCMGERRTRSATGGWDLGADPGTSNGLTLATLQLALSTGAEGGGLYSRTDGTTCLKGVMGRGEYDRLLIVDARVGCVERVSIGTLREICLSKPRFLVPIAFDIPW